MGNLKATHPAHQLGSARAACTLRTEWRTGRDGRAWRGRGAHVFPENIGPRISCIRAAPPSARRCCSSVAGRRAHLNLTPRRGGRDSPRESVGQRHGGRPTVRPSARRVDGRGARGGTAARGRDCAGKWRVCPRRRRRARTGRTLNARASDERAKIEARALTLLLLLRRRRRRRRRRLLLLLLPPLLLRQRRTRCSAADTLGRHHTAARSRGQHHRDGRVARCVQPRRGDRACRFHGGPRRGRRAAR